MSFWFRPNIWRYQTGKVWSARFEAGVEAGFKKTLGTGQDLVGGFIMFYSGSILTNWMLFFQWQLYHQCTIYVLIGFFLDIVSSLIPCVVCFSMDWCTGYFLDPKHLGFLLLAASFPFKQPHVLRIFKSRSLSFSRSTVTPWWPHGWSILSSLHRGCWVLSDRRPSTIWRSSRVKLAGPSKCVTGSVPTAGWASQFPWCEAQRNFILSVPTWKHQKLSRLNPS